MSYIQHLNAMGIISWVPRHVAPSIISVCSLQGQVDAKFQVILNEPPQNQKEQQLLQAILNLLPEYHVAYLSDDTGSMTINTLSSIAVILPNLSEILTQPSLKRKIYQQLSQSI